MGCDPKPRQILVANFVGILGDVFNVISVWCPGFSLPSTLKSGDRTGCQSRPKELAGTWKTSANASFLVWLSRNYAMECTPHPAPLPIGWGEGTRIAALRPVTKW